MAGELKSHMKQSGGAHISTKTWLWKISMSSLYYNHSLTAGKLQAHYLWSRMALKHGKQVDADLQYQVSNETTLTTRQGFFFKKITPVQSITDIILLIFWLIILFWIFVSSATIYFFQKKFIFSNVYISVNTIFKRLMFFF